MSSIGCGGCNSRYHPAHVCLGLPDSVIDAMKEYGGKGVNLSRTSCRLEEEIGINKAFRLVETLFAKERNLVPSTVSLLCTFNYLLRFP